MHAYKPYQILKKIDNAPQLPFDYLYSMLLALVPYLWFETMNPILERVLNPHKKPFKPETMSAKLRWFFVGFNVMLSWFVMKRMF